MNVDLKNKIENITSNQHADESEMLRQLKQLIDETDLERSVVRDSKSITTLVSENINHFTDQAFQGNLIPTGYKDFDKQFGGFALGEYVVIGGRPSMGKTQLLIDLSLKISKSTPVLFFSFDLPEYILCNRYISSLTGIAVNRLLQNQLQEYELKSVLSVTQEFKQHQLYVNDSCHNSISALKAYCNKEIKEKGIKVVIVDYIQLMKSYKLRNSRELEISYISRELKNIAKEFNVSVIATSQLSRAIESRGGGSKHPHLSDLRDSGAIEQDADKVIFIYRPEYYGIELDEEGNNIRGLTELILAKNRNGILGTVRLMRNLNFTGFDDFEDFINDFSFSQSRLDEINSENTSSTNNPDLEEDLF